MVSVYGIFGRGIYTYLAKQYRYVPLLLVYYFSDHCEEVLGSLSRGMKVAKPYLRQNLKIGRAHV